MFTEAVMIPATSSSQGYQQTKQQASMQAMWRMMEDYHAKKKAQEQQKMNFILATATLRTLGANTISHNQLFCPGFSTLLWQSSNISTFIN